MRRDSDLFALEREGRCVMSREKEDERIERDDREKPSSLADKTRAFTANAVDKVRTAFQARDERATTRQIEKEVARHTGDSVGRSREDGRQLDRTVQREDKAADRKTFLRDGHPEDARIRREIVESRIISEGLPSLQAERWLAASDNERLTTLQSLANRTKDMQGREGVYAVGVAKIDGDSVRDVANKTITLNEELLQKGSPKPAVQALMKDLHLVMQQNAVQRPADFRELGIENIQRWADRSDGKAKLSEEDAREYARAVTSGL